MPIIETILIVATCISTFYALTSETLGWVNKNKQACKSVIEFVIKGFKAYTRKDVDNEIQLNEVVIASQERIDYLKKNKKE